MTFTYRPLDLAVDLDLIYDWVTQPRAEFWGMTQHTRAEVEEIYTWIDNADTHHAYLVLDGQTPVALAQSYQPEHDPIGQSYDVLPGDLGAHLFIGPAHTHVPGYTASIYMYLMQIVFADPEVMRIVGEPDVRNAKSLKLADRFAQRHGEIDLGHKKAQLFFLTRAEYEASRG